MGVLESELFDQFRPFLSYQLEFHPISQKISDLGYQLAPSRPTE